MSVTDKYGTAFVGPKNANFILGVDGWEVQSNDYVSTTVVDVLLARFNLVPRESYCSMQKYVGNGIQATVIFSEEDKTKIELISFRVTSDMSQKLEALFREGEVAELVTMFVPSDDAIH